MPVNIQQQSDQHKLKCKNGWTGHNSTDINKILFSIEPVRIQPEKTLHIYEFSDTTECILLLTSILVVPTGKYHIKC